MSTANSSACGSASASLFDDSLARLGRLADALARLDVSSVDRAGCERAITSLALVRRRLDACDVRVARRLAELAEADPAAPPPEQTIAAASRTDARSAARAAGRSRTVAKVPELGEQLDLGTASGEHVDVVGQVLARLSAERRDEFSARHGARLALAASTSTPNELRQLAVALATAFEDEADREARLRRQQRANRLRTWVDRVTGMVRLSGEIDPERGQALLRRLQDEVEARFHGGLPDTAPDDPGERQDHLRALALLGLLLGPSVAETGSGGDDRGGDDLGRDGGGGGGGGGPRRPSGPTQGGGGRGARRPETITVIDLETFRRGRHADTYVDHGVDGLELPIDTIRQRALLGDIIPVWVDVDGVVVQVGDPAGALDLGRSTRLANRTQRRALRVMYARCAVPGCSVAFDHCQPHHIIWWRRGGRTELRNLVPLCSRHHHLVHEGGWVLSMAPNRSLTITRPDGTVMRTGPPRSERR